MVYLAISAISLVVSLPFFIRGNYGVSSYATMSEIGSLASMINQGMQSYQSSFAAYVPSGICNATISNNSIVYNGARYPLYGRIEISQSYLCKNSGNILHFEMQRNAGENYTLSVSSV